MVISMEPFRLVVYLDGSSASRRAIPYLRPLIRSEHVATILLSDESHADEATALFDQADAALQRDPAPERSIRGATPERAIVLESRACKPDLIVFGPLRRQGWRGWLGQSAVRSLARRLTNSILLMQGRPNALHRALLCAAGGTEVLHDAEVTAELLAPIQGQATILHIVSQMPLTFDREERDPQHLTELVMQQETQITQNLDAAKTILHDRNVTTKIRIRAGMVLEQIQEELRTGGYDLLVIGAHHDRSPLDRVLLEDLSSELLLNSPIPVLLVQSAE